MNAEYKIVNVMHEADAHEDQIYIAKSSVTADAIRNGDDTDVLCLCLSAEHATTIIEALNGKREAKEGDTAVGQA